MTEQLGNYLRSLRYEKRWSQSDVSEKLGISIPAYSKIETARTDINLSRLVQLAEVFNISVKDLICMGNSQDPDLLKELADCKRQLAANRKEIGHMQVKLIRLYDELKQQALEYAL